MTTSSVSARSSTSWDPLNPESYQAVFYTAHWALPVALVFGALAALNTARKDGLKVALDIVLGWLRGPRAVAWLTVLGVAAGVEVGVG